MKKAIKYFVAVAAFAAVIAACAKIQSAPTYEADQRYLDAWLEVHHPGVERIGDVAILDDQPGTGAPVADSAWIFVRYTVRGLDGTISESTDENVMKQYGSYNASYYYGPQPWSTDESVMSVGIERGIKGSSVISGASLPTMNVGGKRTFIVPSWLAGTDRLDKEEDYLNTSNSASTYIYELEIVDCTDDLLQWQFDTMQVYSNLHFEGIDTTSYGYYYKQLKEPDDTLEMTGDTTIYINYVGRLINGQVFDTNIKDTAKMYNLYKETATYGPSEATWNSDASSVKLGESTVITGFGMTIARMNKHEKGIALFYSEYGYSYSGSGSTIPAYAPLIFEIEFVDKPDEE